MASNDSEVEKIQKHFQMLSGLAPSLNSASDEMTQAVGVLNDALKKLNIGLSAWVTFRSRGDDDYPQFYDLDQIGYCKLNGTWGIAIQRIWGDESPENPKESVDGPWLFNDAPRELRIHAVDKIPELIGELSKVAAQTQRKIEEKTKQLKSLAAAIMENKSEQLPTAKGISLLQVHAIISNLCQQQKFVGEIVHHAHRWERDDDTLRIYFLSSKRSFAEMLEGREPLGKLLRAVQQVLGTSVNVGVHTEQQLIPAPQRTSKVQK